MSLNHLSRIQDGIDADLEIGCVELKCTGNIETDTLQAHIFTVDTVDVDNLTADIITLNDNASVPNPPVGSTSLFHTGSDLKATDPLGATVTFATTDFVGDYLPRDGSEAMTGNLDMANLDIINCQNIIDTRTIPIDSITVSSASSSTDGDCVVFDGIDGTTIKSIGYPPVIAKYSTTELGPIISNTTVETSILPTDTIIGSLVFDAPQPLGLSIKIRSSAFVAGILAGSNLTLTWKTNSNVLTTYVLAGPLANGKLMLDTDLTIKTGGQALFTQTVNMDGSLPIISMGGCSWDETVVNTMDFTATWDVANAGNAIQANVVNMVVLFI